MFPFFCYCCSDFWIKTLIQELDVSLFLLFTSYYNFACLNRDWHERRQSFRSKGKISLHLFYCIAVIFDPLRNQDMIRVQLETWDNDSKKAHHFSHRRLDEQISWTAETTSLQGMAKQGNQIWGQRSGYKHSWEGEMPFPDKTLDVPVHLLRQRCSSLELEEKSQSQLQVRSTRSRDRTRQGLPEIDDVSRNQSDVDESLKWTRCTVWLTFFMAIGRCWSKWCCCWNSCDATGCSTTVASEEKGHLEDDGSDRDDQTARIP